MKRLIFTLIIALQSQLCAQDSTNTETLSSSQNAALYAMTGVMVPLVIAGTVVSFFPPSGGVIVKDGVTYGTLSIETGYGDGTVQETGEFTDYRITLAYAHVFNSKVRDVYRVDAKKDFNFSFIDRRKIFLQSVGVSAGLFTDFPNHGYSIGGGVWLKSPWLPFFGLFPSHTYGITYRYNKYFNGNNFHEISLGVTSALTF